MAGLKVLNKASAVLHCISCMKLLPQLAVMQENQKRKIDESKETGTSVSIQMWWVGQYSSLDGDVELYLKVPWKTRGVFWDSPIHGDAVTCRRAARKTGIFCRWHSLWEKPALIVFCPGYGQIIPLFVYSIQCFLLRWCRCFSQWRMQPIWLLARDWQWASIS